MARSLRLVAADPTADRLGRTAEPRAEAPAPVDPAAQVLAAVGATHAVALVDGLRCRGATPAFAHLVGASAETLTARGLTGPGARQVREQVDAVVASGAARTGVVLVGPGSSTWRADFHPVPGSSAVAVVATDLTGVAAELVALRHDASHDPLTGLLNRRELTDRLDAGLARAARDPRRSVVVVFLDLDGFKRVNDEWGHRVGDAVLSAVARRLSGVVRAGDTLSRVGGDEFVLVREGEEGTGDLLALRERVERVLAEPVEADGRVVAVGISLGAARARAGQTGAEVVDAADRAMYAGRRARTRGLPAVRRPRAAAPEPG